MRPLPIWYRSLSMWYLKELSVGGSFCISPLIRLKRCTSKSSRLPLNSEYNFKKNALHALTAAVDTASESLPNYTISARSPDPLSITTLYDFSSLCQKRNWLCHIHSLYDHREEPMLQVELTDYTSLWAWLQFGGMECELSPSAPTTLSILVYIRIL